MLQLKAVVTVLHGMQTWSSDENSVCLSNACIVTKRKKDLSRFSYHTKDNLPLLSEKKNGNNDNVGLNLKQYPLK